MFCMRCGTELPDVARFCFSCGTRVDDSLPSSRTTGPTLLELSCPSCGARLQVSPDRKRFDCQHCGKGLAVVADELTANLKMVAPRVERCEIRLDSTNKRNSKWVQEALMYTPKGLVVIARAPNTDEGVMRLYDELARAGWQKVGQSIFERSAED